MRASLIFLLAVACGDGRYPWEGEGKPPEQVAPPASSSLSFEPTPHLLEDPAPHGGLFVRCLQGLQAERDPVKDLTRIVMSCGPSTGMDPVGQGMIEGALAQGAPVTFDLPMAKDRCYRVFAVADGGIAELDVEVRSSRGTTIASDHMTGRIAVAQPDRPFCTSADDVATISVTSGGGSGAFSLEVLSVQALAR